MRDEQGNVAPEIRADIGALISHFQALGWAVTGSVYDAKVFGNWYVDFEGRSPSIRLAKDRSQYMVSKVPIEMLKGAGLYLAFDDLEEFRVAVSRWVATLNGDGGNTPGPNRAQ